MANMDATYEVRPPEPSKKRISVGELALLVAGIVAALSIAVAALLHSNDMNSSQSVSTRALDQSNTQLSAEIGRLKSDINSLTNQLANVNNRLAQTDAKVNDPLPNFVTCADLRHMNLTVTDSGSVSAVPGPVSLDVSPVVLPSHCR